MKVSIIVIARDSGNFLEDLLNDILAQSYEKKNIQLIFVDGCSTDNTKEIFENFKNGHGDEYFSIVIRDNLKKIQPSGCNVALREVLGNLVTRIDAHSRIPENFISENVLLHEKGNLVTGGITRNIIDGNSKWKKLLLFLEDSFFGSKVAPFRNNAKENMGKYVKTMAHAMYDVFVYRDVGGYDERLARAEDNEIHYRMQSKGYKFFFSENISSSHYVRGSFSTMLKQKFLNGKWIGLTMSISPKCFSIYHFVPFLFVSTLIFFLIFSSFWICKKLLMFELFLYFFICLIFTIFSMREKKFEFIYLISPILFFMIHCAYGIGTIYGLLSIPFWKSKNENKKCDEIDEVKKILNERFT